MPMTALTSAATRPPETLAARARAALGALADAPWDVLGDDDLLASALDLVAARSALRAAEARVLVEIDRRDLARRSLGWGSTADWLTHVAGLRVSQGRQAVAHAHELVGDRAATLAALVAGTVSPEQAALVIDAVEELPAETALRTRAETSLLEKADHLHATDLARAAVRVVDEVDPGRAARERERQRDRLARASHRRRFLSISDDGAGGVRVRGRGSAEDAAVLRQALLPLTAPAPSVDPQTGERLSDPRDHGARTWDALVQVAQHALDTDAVPGSHGERTRVSVTIPWEQLRDAAGATRGGETDDGLTLSAGTVRRMACDATVIPAVLGAESAVLDLGREARVVSASLWRALVARDTHCTFPGCGRPPGDVPRPPRRALGRRRPHRPGQPGPALRPPPPHHPRHTVAGADGLGRPTGVPPTDGSVGDRLARVLHVRRRAGHARRLGGPVRSTRRTIRLGQDPPPGHGCPTRSGPTARRGLTVPSQPCN